MVKYWQLNISNEFVLEYTPLPINSNAATILMLNVMQSK